MNCRKNFTELTTDERNRLAAALNDLYSDGVIDSFANEHNANFNSGIHWGPAFLPWHRHFLRRLEELLQAIDSSIMLPYWDWTRADSRDLDAEPWKSFFGGRDNNGGEFDHWSYVRAASVPLDDEGQPIELPTLADIVEELQETTYADYRGLEFSPGSHVPGHTWTGGTMAGGHSPRDPLFYLHHGNIDRLWAVWQRNNPGADQYTHSDGRADIEAARVPLNDPMIGGATPASMLDHLSLGYQFPRDFDLENAWAAAGLGTLESEDPTEVGLAPPVLNDGIVFNDVPEGETTVRAAVFTVSACETVTFEIIDGPTVTSGPPETEFGVPFGPPLPVEPGDDRGHVWLSFTGTSDGDTATGTVTIRCDQTGDEWDILISANTINRPTVATVLVLDQSGSMEDDAGDGRKRIDVLKESAPVFVELLREDDGVGVVRFDHDAYPGTPVDFAGPIPFGTGRTVAKSAISAHIPNPSGRTSIGDGIVLAHSDLDSPSVTANYDETAIVVLTDGRENSEQYISDISDIIGDRVFGIGLGTSEHINPGALTELTNSRGGYVLMTGVLDADDYFILQKYYLQILAGVTNAEIVLDPEGWLKPGQVHRIPFRLNEADITTDVILLTAKVPPQTFRFAVETPSGALIDPGTASATPGISYALGSNALFYRMTLPTAVGGDEEREGEWNVVLRLDEKYYRRYLSTLDNDPEELGRTETHGVRYNVNVHSSSNLRMKARLLQDSYEPGATLTLRVVLTEYGLPVHGRATVHADLIRPDETGVTLALSEVEPGVFEVDTTAAMSGVYKFRVLASGRTFRNQPFTREHLLTGSVWRGGDEPAPTRTAHPDAPPAWLCRFVGCLLSDESLVKLFRERGVDIDALRKCLAIECKEFGSAREPRSDPRSAWSLAESGSIKTTDLLDALRRLSGGEARGNP